MYNKLFEKLLDSSIWLETYATRIVWITFIAAMDEDGFCNFASVRNLARRAAVTDKEAAKAVAMLESPDLDSSDPDHGGRRIERVPGGWMVLNARKYRDMSTRAQIRESTRDRVQKHRNRKRDVTPDVTPVTLQGVTCNGYVTQAEAVSEAEARAEGEARRSATSTTPPDSPAWLSEPLREAVNTIAAEANELLELPPPEDANELQCAMWFWEQLGQVGDVQTNRICSESLRLYAREKRLPVSAITVEVLARAKIDRANGATINRFWFTDGRFKKTDGASNGKRAEPAVSSAAERNRRAREDAAAFLRKKHPHLGIPDEPGGDHQDRAPIGRSEGTVVQGIVLVPSRGDPMGV